jgi:hypothetical protein
MESFMFEITVNSLPEYVKTVTELNNELHPLWYRGVYDESFTPSPRIIWDKTSQKFEKTLVHRFLTKLPQYVDDKSLSNWELYALMQHHGLPTRLLDWSESALVAYYFSLANKYKEDHSNTIWFINPYKLNEKSLLNKSIHCPGYRSSGMINNQIIDFDTYLPENLRPPQIKPSKGFSPFAINTTHSSKRIASQKGVFTVHSIEGESLIDYLKRESPKHIGKINIKIESEYERLSALYELNNLGINHEFIYQDLDSLAQDIKNTFYLD